MCKHMSFCPSVFQPIIPITCLYTMMGCGWGLRYPNFVHTGDAHIIRTGHIITMVRVFLHSLVVETRCARNPALFMTASAFKRL